MPLFPVEVRFIKVYEATDIGEAAKKASLDLPNFHEVQLADGGDVGIATIGVLGDSDERLLSEWERLRATFNAPDGFQKTI